MYTFKMKLNITNHLTNFSFSFAYFFFFLVSISHEYINSNCCSAALLAYVTYNDNKFCMYVGLTNVGKYEISPEQQAPATPKGKCILLLSFFLCVKTVYRNDSNFMDGNRSEVVQEYTKFKNKEKYL